jgi:hypothetical protein
MRKSFRKFAFLLLAAVATSLGGCTDPTDDGKYTDPITLYEKVQGDWSLVNLTQTDETAKAASLQPQEMSIYSQFEFGTFAISFDVDATFAPTTYEVTGSAPNLFPASGYWDLSTEHPQANATAPVIRLYSDASLSTLIGELAVTSTPGANPEMDLRLTRTSDGVPFVSYTYKLSPTNSNAE